MSDTTTHQDLGAADRFVPPHTVTAQGWLWGVDKHGNYWATDGRGWVDVDDDEVPAEAVRELALSVAAA